MYLNAIMPFFLYYEIKNILPPTNVNHAVLRFT